MGKQTEVSMLKLQFILKAEDGCFVTINPLANGLLKVDLTSPFGECEILESVEINPASLYSWLKAHEQY